MEIRKKKKKNLDSPEAEFSTQGQEGAWSYEKKEKKKGGIY